MSVCSNCDGLGIVYIGRSDPKITDVCCVCRGIGGKFRFWDTAREIATVGHSGEYRRGKDGKPSNEAYLHHLRRVADHFEDDPVAEAVSWLHDGIENHPDKINRKSLEAVNMPQTVIVAVEAITKGLADPLEDYNDYLDRLSENETAVRVKIRDICDNLGSYPTKEQIQKYAHALAVLLRTNPVL